MPLNLNKVSKQKLRNSRLGLSEEEIDRTMTFLRDNAIFRSKSEWKKKCKISDQRYEALKTKVIVPSKAGIIIPKKVTTHAYRKRNHITDSDVDVGHIVAHANGGADHPDNYVLMNKHYNRKLGNLHDGIIFAHFGEDRLRKAIRVSRLQKRYKGTFAGAKRLAKKALKMKSELSLYVEGFLGGIEETDDETDEFLLRHRGYCKELISKWKKRYPAN